MTIFGAADLDALLAQMGVSVTFGSTTVNGLFDRDDVFLQDPSGMHVSTRRQSVLVKTGALAGLTVNSAITVDGNPYHIRDVSLEPGDGAFTRITLAAG